MSTYILTAAAIVLVCLLLTKVSGKAGVPTLALFIVLGMVFGSDGLLKIPFDDFVISEQICTVALLFIIFYGGFGTRWQQAKPIALQATLLSTLGVILTAGMTGAFCHYVLNFAFWESMLIGAVISSTDAASVFSILRSKKLNLKHGTASLLEVESGSNDPCSYMLTFIVLSVMGNNFDGDRLLLMVTQQVLLGVTFGAAAGFVSAYALRCLNFSAEGGDAILVFGMALVAYAGADYCGGNGYLSVYIMGIVLGNQPIQDKKKLVHFFDGITGLMQITLFFLLGLLSFPSQLPHIFLPAFGIALFLTFIARPLAVFMILMPFKCPFNQQLLVSWTGLRGAASIVFAIMATVNSAYTPTDVFHITFFIVLFSIITQGSLIPFAARKLNMIDANSNVMKTFSDYSDETPVQFVQFTIMKGHPWANKAIREITRIPDLLLVMILRNGERILPRGDVTMLENDVIVLTAMSVDTINQGMLTEMLVEANNKWINISLQHISMDKNSLVIAIQRDNTVFIPDGKTIIMENDVLIMSKTEHA